MSGPQPKPFECPEPVFWYLVGLIATDGCLLEKNWLVNITSKDRSLLVQIQQAVHSRGWISTTRGSSGNPAYRWELKSKVLWNKLVQVGLTPRKTLTIGALAVPDSMFKEFFRGVIDGDGNIRCWNHPTNGRTQWAVRIVGCSKPFFQWMQETIHRLWRVEGVLHEEAPKPATRHTKYTLKYGKIAAKVILAECYYAGALALDRKRVLAEQCATSVVGWSKSKTVGDPERWRSWKYGHVFLHPPARALPKSNDIDPAAGLVAERIPLWRAGVAKLGETHWA